MRGKASIMEEAYGLPAIKNKVVLLFLALVSMFFIVYIFIFNKIGETKEGYYYSNYLVNPKNYSNTNNLKEINGSIEAFSPDRFLIKMAKKNIDDVIFFRILLGREPDYNMDATGLFMNNIEIYDNSGNIYSISGNKGIGYFKKVMKNVGDSFFIKMGRAPLGNNIFIRRIEVSSIPHNLYIFHIFNKSLLFSMVAIFILFLLLRGLKIIKANNIILFSSLLIIILFAFSMRFQECLRVFYNRIDGDAQGYFGYAKQMLLFSRADGFFSGNFWTRGPFYPFVSKLFLAVWGYNQHNMRFISFYFAIVVIILTFLLTYRFSSSYFVSMFSVFLLANSHTLIEQSTYGLRTELEAILFLILFYSLFSKKELFFKNTLLAGISGGLLLLTRWHYIIAVLVLPILSYLFFKDRCFSLNKRMKSLLLSLAVSFALFLPHQICVNKNLNKSGQGLSTGDLKYMASFEGITIKNEDATMAKYIFRYHEPKHILAPALGTILAISYLPMDLMNLRIYFNDILRSIQSKSLKMHFQFPIHYGFILITFLLMLMYVFIESKGRILIIFLTIFSGLSYSILFYGLSVMRGRPILDIIRTIQPVQPFIAYLLSYTIVYFMKKFFSYSKVIASL